jgi:dihydroorotase
MASHYTTPVAPLPDTVAGIVGGRLRAAPSPEGSRLIVRGGRLVDPMNGIDDGRDLAFVAGRVAEVAETIQPERGDRVVDAEGLLVVPGLVEVHLHLGDLFETSSEPIFEAVASGTTLAISPGAGNTYMSPSLLGAEVDRGVPLNIGVLLGIPNVFGTTATFDDVVAYFRGELDEEEVLRKFTRNRITARTGNLAVGIKDHMGHFVAPDERLDQAFELASRAGLFFMSHCQDPDHAERVAGLARGRRVHLAHVTIAGSGTHGDPAESLARCIALCRDEHVSAEFLTTQLRPGLGNRDGLSITEDAQPLAYEALRDGVVDILTSDGQCDATMKGGGDTRDNIPCLVELVDEGVLDVQRAIATMTVNPVRRLAEATGQAWWTEELGHLGVGARANATVIDWRDKAATYTIVAGAIAAVEGRPVRRANGLGGWVSRFGIIPRTGVGDLPLWETASAPAAEAARAS